MGTNLFRLVLLCYGIVVYGGVFSAYSAETASKVAAQVESFRKGDATITVQFGTKPIENAKISVKQIRHHFGFGAAVAYNPMFIDSVADTAKYRAAFRNYFEWATPENCQKWPSTDYTQGVQNYAKPDSILAWCKANDITMRGHNLFWNQKMEWMPEWAQTLTGSAGKDAIDERISTCLTYYKGECAHWDIINEMIHGEAGSNGKTGTLEVMTGDPGIYPYILNESAKIETFSKFTLNDYNILSRWSNLDDYATKVNSLISQGCKVDVLGCEGHFGEDWTVSDFTTKLNNLANKVDREIWLTEVDFSVANPGNVIGEMMDACFAHEKVGGIVLWAFWQGNLWRDNLTSYVVTTDFQETEMGKVWREKIAGWTTIDSGVCDANGEFTFNGYYGKYAVAIENEGETFLDTIYVDPDSANKIPVAIDQANRPAIGGIRAYANRTVLVGSSAISFRVPVSVNGPLFLTAYSLSGRVLAQLPLTFFNGVGVAEGIPAGCHVYTIGTADQTIHAAMGLMIRQ